MHNFLVLCIQVLIVCSISLIALRIGEKALNAWLCVVAISMNLFVIKQIKLCGLDVTATDALAVGYVLGLNLIQEYYGRRAAQWHVAISFLCSVGFVGLSYIHLWYIPNQFDTTHAHYAILLDPLPRLLFASLTSFIVIQFLDISLFAYLREKFSKRFLGIRTAISLLASQTLDTFLFRFLGLYGLVHNLWHIIILSLIIKGLIITLCAPFAELSRFKCFQSKKPLPRKGVS